tara:strand:+ start:514 stop:1512 length:999 start_codon:yes stop_codon:yes gene_type:complete
LFGIKFVGCGSAIPSQIIKNDDLSLRVETNDSWIRSRTGISQRHVIGENETLTELGAEAAKKALKMAGWNSESIDLLILATSSPDDLFGSAPQIQSALGAHKAVAFDLTAACSGFLFAVITAYQYLLSGTMKRVLIVGADQLTRWVDWDDRRSCVLFGDAAGAILMESIPDIQDDFIGFSMRSDGSRGNSLNLPNIKEYQQLIPEKIFQKGGFSPIQMNGKEVYKFAVREVPLILEELLNSHRISPSDLNWLLLHQANQRILEAVADRFNIPYEKVLSNLANYGNTSAATIPLMLDEAVNDGRIKPGDLIASSGFGAGLSWGAALFRWHGPI